MLPIEYQTISNLLFSITHFLKFCKFMQFQILNFFFAKSLPLDLIYTRLPNMLNFFANIILLFNTTFLEWDKYIDGYDDIKEGDILRGYVKSCSKIGVFVR